MNRNERLEQILTVGLTIAATKGLHEVKLQTVADLAGVTHTMVLHCAGSAKKLRDMVARRAIETNNRDVITYLIATRHPLILAAAAG